MASRTISSGGNEVSFETVDGARLRALRKRYGRHIRVSRRDYEIVFCTSIRFEDKEPAGLCMPWCSVILIHDDKETPIEETLTHELVHAELHEAGFHQRGSWDADVEEQIAEVLAKGLSAAFVFRQRGP